MPTRSQVRVMRTLHLDAIPELSEDAEEGVESQSQTSHKRKSSGSSSGSSKRTKDLEPEEEGNLYNEWTRVSGFGQMEKAFVLMGLGNWNCGFACACSVVAHALWSRVHRSGRWAEERTSQSRQK